MLASEASLLTDEMIGAAAHSLSGLVDPGQPGAPVLPPFNTLLKFLSKLRKLLPKAQEQGLAQAEEKTWLKLFVTLNGIQNINEGG